MKLGTRTFGHPACWEPKQLPSWAVSKEQRLKERTVSHRVLPFQQGLNPVREFEMGQVSRDTGHPQYVDRLRCGQQSCGPRDDVCWTMEDLSA